MAKYCALEAPSVDDRRGARCQWCELRPVIDRENYFWTQPKFPDGGGELRNSGLAR